MSVMIYETGKVLNLLNQFGCHVLLIKLNGFKCLESVCSRVRELPLVSAAVSVCFRFHLWKK